MDGGKVVEMGPPEQVIDQPSSARLRQFLQRFNPGTPTS
jgi:polar amino acid transport system ATP-binding protein